MRELGRCQTWWLRRPSRSELSWTPWKADWPPVGPRLASLALACCVGLVGCRATGGADGSAAVRSIDRSDAVATAEALVMALVASDVDSLQTLVVPEERDSLRTLRAAAQAAKAGGTPVPEDIEVTARLVKLEGDVATVDYDGSYCLAAQKHEVTATTVGSPGNGRGGADNSFTVDEPRRCFDLAEIFQTEGIKYRRIDGAWYGPLPK